MPQLEISGDSFDNPFPSPLTFVLGQGSWAYLQQNPGYKQGGVMKKQEVIFGLPSFPCLVVQKRFFSYMLYSGSLF